MGQSDFGGIGKSNTEYHEQKVKFENGKSINRKRSGHTSVLVQSRRRG